MSPALNASALLNNQTEDTLKYSPTLLKMASKEGQDASVECGMELRNIGDIYCRRQERLNLSCWSEERVCQCGKFAKKGRNTEPEQKSEAGNGTECRTAFAVDFER